MGLVDDEHDAPMSLRLLGGEQVGGLGNELRLGVAGHAAESDHDGRVEAAGPEGAVADVDDLVAGPVESGDGGPDRHGLAAADVANDHAQGALGDAEADARHRLRMSRSGEEVGGGDALGEGGSGQPEVGDPGGAAAHCDASRSSRSRYEMEPAISSS